MKILVDFIVLYNFSHTSKDYFLLSRRRTTNHIGLVKPCKSFVFAFDFLVVDLVLSEFQFFFVFINWCLNGLVILCTSGIIASRLCLGSCSRRGSRRNPNRRFRILVEKKEFLPRKVN